MAFTIKEFRELVKLPNVRAVVPPKYFQEVHVKGTLFYFI